ncbi:MAG TPA: hydroxymethylbilane synthase [Syntrophomonas sp.]|nr:hydroxymethylbilane synthase [Syntrophomonas sp.]HPT68673.1 hydroxymethylbilane synthase [Syntrophomonas sp.]
MQVLRLGTRGSKLALWQAEYVARELSSRLAGVDIQIITIKTKGDKILDVPLAQIGDKGLFTREIENELLDGTIDLAVHSMKDLPSLLGEGLCLGAVMPREDPHDVFISTRHQSLASLPAGATIGTSSLRRAAQLKKIRPDIKLVNMRGNVETRIRKMEEQELDGIILAYAGVKRLGYENFIKEIIAEEDILPAVGQGAVAIELRADDKETYRLVQTINDHDTWLETTAERAFLARLEGGCQVPIACLAKKEEHHLKINGLVASLDGSRVYKASLECGFDDVASNGRQLAEQLLARGAGQILDEIRLQGE